MVPYFAWKKKQGQPVSFKLLSFFFLGGVIKRIEQKNLELRHIRDS